MKDIVTLIDAIEKSYEQYHVPMNMDVFHWQEEGDILPVEMVSDLEGDTYEIDGIIIKMLYKYDTLWIDYIDTIIWGDIAFGFKITVNPSGTVDLIGIYKYVW